MDTKLFFGVAEELVPGEFTKCSERVQEAWLVFRDESRQAILSVIVTDISYTELEWREANILGAALRECLLELAGAGFEEVEVVPLPGRGTHLILARNLR